jgi:hypothetical protein
MTIKHGKAVVVFESSAGACRGAGSGDIEWGFRDPFD